MTTSDDDEEEEEEDDDKEDCFYDSLDRKLSNSNSNSNSNSSSDTSPLHPMYDYDYSALISHSGFSSSSLQQRRHRLLLSLRLSPHSFPQHPTRIPITPIPNNDDSNINVNMCTIKNLDTGTQFVVDQVTDNNYNVSEVGTGRQFTMAESHDYTSSSSSSSTDKNDGRRRNKAKKRVSWFQSVRSVIGVKERGFDGPQRVRIRQCGKSVKELSGVYKTQEFRAHEGSVWSIVFSLDGRYLASAGEDRAIHVWEVVEAERRGELLRDGSEDSSFGLLDSLSEDSFERGRWGRTSERVVVPETVFGLSEKPFCSFQGHLDDVLDLSWSKSQLLLSSSMDKTVRLWSLSSKTCLKIFSHSDYVTCIQFNPVDDRYFISGSLDAKVRIWSIPERQVVDWKDLHEMVTAACYTPDGQGALVGSYNGICHLYDTSENKLQPKSQINLKNKKKKSHMRKITGFQFAPGSSSEVLITSSDSRIRVVDGVDRVHKFKGFRNTNSQISASITTNGKYVVCASEDSHVYVWKHKGESQPGSSKDKTMTNSYEHFHCQDVSVAIPWPGIGDSCEPNDPCSRDNEPTGASQNLLDDTSKINQPPPTTPTEGFSGIEGSPSAAGCSRNPFHGTISAATKSYFFDRFSATWPEEKLLLDTKNQSPRPSSDYSNGVIQNRSAWGLVIVTAGMRGEIRTFQNFGLPVRL